MGRRLIARISNSDAELVEPHLESEGVDTERVRSGSDPPTYSLILLDGDGRRMVATGG